MDAATLLNTLLADSAMTKSQLAQRARISRALLDDYLKGHKQPAFRRVNELVEASGHRLEVHVTPRPRPAPPALLEVLEFGELFPTPAREPLPSLSHIWNRDRVSP